MILIASNTIPNCDSVPQSMNLDGSDIKHAKQFVTQVSVLILLSLSEKHISSIYRISCMKIRQISAMCHYLTKDVPHKTIVCVLFFQD